jgi:hypothetical protein
MTTLQVFNPVAEAVQYHVAPAERPTSLAGKRVGLYWNMKVGGDAALRAAQNLIAAQFGSSEFIPLRGDVGVSVRHATEVLAEEVARSCDVVIGTSAD